MVRSPLILGARPLFAGHWCEPCVAKVLTLARPPRGRCGHYSRADHDWALHPKLLTTRECGECPHYTENWAICPQRYPDVPAWGVYALHMVLQTAFYALGDAGRLFRPRSIRWCPGRMVWLPSPPVFRVRGVWHFFSEKFPKKKNWRLQSKMETEVEPYRSKMECAIPNSEPYRTGFTGMCVAVRLQPTSANQHLTPAPCVAPDAGQSHDVGAWRASAIPATHIPKPRPIDQTGRGEAAIGMVRPTQMCFGRAAWGSILGCVLNQPLRLRGRQTAVAKADQNTRDECGHGIKAPVPPTCPRGRPFGRVPCEAPRVPR